MGLYDFMSPAYSSLIANAVFPKCTTAVWEDALWYDVPPHISILHVWVGVFCLFVFFTEQDSSCREEIQTVTQTNTLIIASLTSVTFAISIFEPLLGHLKESWLMLWTEILLIRTGCAYITGIS